MVKRKRPLQSEHPVKKRRGVLPTYLPYLVLVAAIAIFLYLCSQYDLTQDDAYISFRYAANLLNGDGLVYNAGERVEGYTNFLWVMLLALFKGVFGIDYLSSSRIMGMTGGALIFLLVCFLVRHHLQRHQLALYAALAVMLLSNLSLPYWSIASLETTAFACMVLAALVTEYRRPHLTPALLVIATLLRPEGGLVFVVILLDRFIREHRFPFRYTLIYIVPLLPFLVFKLFYYGSLFPNPYYAKSGVGFEYILSGLEYLWHFTSTIGLYGIIFAAPLLAIRRLWGRYSLLYLFLAFYLAYIVWVGGDVLKVYRFYVPLVSVLYFLFLVAVRELFSRVVTNRIVILNMTWLVAVAFAAGSFLLSHEHVKTFWFAEREFIPKMEFVSSMLRKHMGPDFSIAASTIGRAGYELLGHRVIDMLGLTDSYIARHPEEIEGIESTWKERRFNNSYLLEQQPDFILFSTGYKPSAPAERALFLHSEFRHNYTTTGFLLKGQYKVVWRRVGEVDMSRDVVHPDLEFVTRLNAAYNYLMVSDYRRALPEFKETWRLLGEERAINMCNIGDCYHRLNVLDSAYVYLNRALELDPNCWEARLRLINDAQNRADTTTFMLHYRALQQNSPWVLDYSRQYE